MNYEAYNCKLKAVIIWHIDLRTIQANSLTPVL